MQAKLALDEAELGRRDEPAVRHADAVERAVEIGVPEIEEVGELWKARREIVRRLRAASSFPTPPRKSRRRRSRRRWPWRA
jgi:hypothetical protein